MENKLNSTNLANFPFHITRDKFPNVVEDFRWKSVLAVLWTHFVSLKRNEKNSKLA